METKRDDTGTIYNNFISEILPDDIDITNKTPSSKELVAETLTRLPADTLKKLLLAEDRANKAGDKRSILDTDKFFSLLKEADPDYFQSILNKLDMQKPIVDAREQQDSIVAEEDGDKLGMEALDPEYLADTILKLCGLKDGNGFLHVDLQAQYPNITKANLVKLGAVNLFKMLGAYNASEKKDDMLDNRTPIAKFNKYMGQIAAGQAPGRQKAAIAPIEEHSNFISDLKK